MSSGDDEDCLDVDSEEGFWKEFEERWEEQFQRLNEAEDEFLRRISDQIHNLALIGSAGYEEAVGAAVAEGDRKAREIAAVAAQVTEAERAHAVREVHYGAEQARRDAVNSALQESDDLARGIAEAAARRKEEREARRREEKRRRDAELEARRRSRCGADEQPGRPPGGPPPSGRPSGGGDAGSAGSAAGPRAGAAGAGPRLGSSSTASARPSRSAAFASFAEYDTAWKLFEDGLKGQGGDVGAADVPWPAGLASVSGVQAADSAKERKQKLRAAVLRWHPDKWMCVLQRVRPEERADVMARVQEVTRRILAERKLAGS